MALTSAITIDFSPSIVNQRVHILTGSNSTSIATIQLSGVEGSVIQPTATTWRAEIRLVPGINKITIKGLDLAGNTTASLTKDITLPNLTSKQHLVHNTFDEFGVVLHLTRLPGEKNLPYKQRLFDVRLHPADTTVRGLTYGTARELGIKVTPAITIRSPLDLNLTTTRAISGAVRITGVYLDLLSPRFVANECHTIEPATLSVTLIQTPDDESSIEVFTMNGDRVLRESWSYERKTNRLLITDRNLSGKDIAVKFIYIHRIPLTDITLTDLESRIENVVDDDNNPLFLVEILTDPSIPAEDLIPTRSFVSITEDAIVFEKCALRVRELHDVDFQQSLLNSDGHAIGTKLENWAKRINTQTRIVWNSTLLDDSQWEPLGPEPSLGALPHLSDAAKGHWYSLDPTETTKFTLKDYRRYNGVSPKTGALLKYRGIKPLEFQSGTGTQNDLKVLDIVEL